MPPRGKRWRAIAATILGFAFLAALIAFQTAAATGSAEPDGLQPPFTFRIDDSLSASYSYVPIPPTAQRLLTETFESGFNPSVGVTGTTTAWRVFTDTGSANFYWARVEPNDTDIYTDTAWAACGLCDGSGGSRNPDTDNYPPNMGTWLIYGPLDLRNYYAAEVSFNYLLDANPAIDGAGNGDFFGVGASDDGSVFDGFFRQSGNLMSAGWLTGAFSLANYAGKSGVYVGFYFYSNGDVSVGKGAFIDNVSLRAMPYLKTFLPSVYKAYAIATPPPAYFRNYEFEGTGGGQDFRDWGGAYIASAYGQALTTGKSGNGMFLYNSLPYDIAMAGPNLAAPTNFEINVDLKVFAGKDKGRYGVVFGAASNTFGRSGSTPTFNVNTTQYRFSLQFPDAGAGSVPAYYVLERCDGGDGFNCAKLILKTTLPGGLATGNWDTVTIRRVGASISILINGTPLASSSDGNYVGSLEFGVYTRSEAANSGSSPLEIHFDNFRVTQLP